MGPSRPGCSTPRSWHHRDRRRVRSSATSGRSYRSAAMSRADIRPGTRATKTSRNRSLASRPEQPATCLRAALARKGRRRCHHLGVVPERSRQSVPARGRGRGAGAPPATSVSGTAAGTSWRRDGAEGLVAEVGCLLTGVEEAVQRVAVVDVHQQPSRLGRRAGRARGLLSPDPPRRFLRRAELA
jgi:hypothetical protein